MTKTLQCHSHCLSCLYCLQYMYTLYKIRRFASLHLNCTESYIPLNVHKHKYKFRLNFHGVSPLKLLLSLAFGHLTRKFETYDALLIKISIKKNVSIKKVFKTEINLECVLHFPFVKNWFVLFVENWFVQSTIVLASQISTKCPTGLFYFHTICFIDIPFLRCTTRWGKIIPMYMSLLSL